MRLAASGAHVRCEAKGALHMIGELRLLVQEFYRIAHDKEKIPKFHLVAGLIEAQRIRYWKSRP
jgi:hypothetical protein